MSPIETVSTLKMAELTILDAMIFQEVISRTESKIPTVASTLSKKPFKVSFADVWEMILHIDYQPIFKMALDLVKAIPSAPQTEDALLILAVEAQRIASSRALLRHDLMGRIYHLLLMRDIAKYHATYYTSVPAAYLLARFSLEAPNPEWQIDWANLISIGKFRLADLACGSGTLLSAAYSAILDNHVTAAANQDLNANPKELHRILLEDVLKGFDVLSFAAHLTAVTLALHNPASFFNSTGIYSVPLSASNGKPRLGSIDLLEDTKLISTISLTGDVASPEKQGLEATEKAAVEVKDLDFIIMNPPFTRSVGGNLLFGALPPEQRKELQKALAELLKKRNYSGIGQAGLAAVFVAVANNCLKDGGRLAIVLPRSLLSGISWKKIRTLLSDNYHVELIVSSHQAPKDWNFSENTDLGEILLVARKKTEDEDETPEKTIFANLWHKPENEMESVVMAGKLVELNKTLLSHTTNYDVLENANAAPYQLLMGNHMLGEAYSVNPDVMEETVDTWGQLTAFAQTCLNRTSRLFVSTGQLHIPGNGSCCGFPIVNLEDISDKIGSDKPHRMKEFRKVQYKTLYPSLWGHDSTLLKRISTTPTDFMEVNPGKGQRASTLWARRGCMMVAERLRLNTMRIIATELSEPALASEWWPITLKSLKMRGNYNIDARSHETIQVLWLNSTFGLLSWLTFREDTEGPWVAVKSETLRLIPMLNLRKLKPEQTADLLGIFEVCAQQDLPSIPQQFQQAINKNGWRYELDKKLVEIITGKQVDLTPLYEMIARETIMSLKPLA